jgi:hypothetical protein
LKLILHAERLIEPEGLAKRGQLLHRGLAGQHGRRGVARQAQRDEHQRDHAESHERGVDELAHGVARHRRPEFIMMGAMGASRVPC